MSFVVVFIIVLFYVAKEDVWYVFPNEEPFFLRPCVSLCSSEMGLFSKSKPKSKPKTKPRPWETFPADYFWPEVLDFYVAMNLSQTKERGNSQTKTGTITMGESLGVCSFPPKFFFILLVLF